MGRRNRHVSRSVPVNEVRFDRNALKKMDPAERRLMIIMGHVTNDLMAVHRLLIYCNNHPTKRHLLHVAGVCQSLVVNRFLMGMMREIWKVLEREVIRSPALGKHYHDAMGRNFPKESGDLQRLKTYFGSTQGKHLLRIRDKFVFHYQTDEWDIENHWEKVPEDNLVFHISQMRVNSFYEFSHEVITRAMLAEADADLGKAFAIVYDDVLKVSGWLLGVVHAVMHEAVGRLATNGTLPVHKVRRVPASNPYTIRVPALVNEKARRPRIT